MKSIVIMIMIINNYILWSPLQTAMFVCTVCQIPKQVTQIATVANVIMQKYIQQYKTNIIGFCVVHFSLSNRIDRRKRYICPTAKSSEYCFSTMDSITSFQMRMIQYKHNPSTCSSKWNHKSTITLQRQDKHIIFNLLN